MAAVKESSPFNVKVKYFEKKIAILVSKNTVASPSNAETPVRNAKHEMSPASKKKVIYFEEHQHRNFGVQEHRCIQVHGQRCAQHRV